MPDVPSAPFSRCAFQLCGLQLSDNVMLLVIIAGDRAHSVCSPTMWWRTPGGRRVRRYEGRGGHAPW